ncbi:NUDIX hydrolase [Fictibacillus enclensis]|uniref:NUDIX hydrolase n=1 Tax=Fictibacillus enclensis TaxID=1017270 RepID=UPI0024BF8895|nr:NUDIX hydrolase [Fictibacillus enclensis]MDM5199598.1 NUDIX hydrolase [Fictibacillus enclensis]MDM5338836.1 NUDIX hydrolase [Fictibacillus enclensis]WHY70331.1 NUDIX hydrolase [Fictibacillus enclensis]
MEHLNEKTLSTESVYEGKIIDLEIQEVELPNGNKSKREIIRHPGAVAIIAITPENKLLFVRQFRKALDKIIVEIPAGKLEKDEDPQKCAERELLEETGYECENLEYLTSFYTSPGFADELIHLFYTDSLKECKEQQPDEDEFLDVMEVTLEEALELVNDQQIHDAKTAYAVQYEQLKRKMENHA